MRRAAWWVIVAALLVAAGCGGDGDDKGPTATVDQYGGASTTDATPEEEVEAAYLKSWDVYTKALRTLEGSEYEDVFHGDALTLGEFKGSLQQLGGSTRLVDLDRGGCRCPRG